VVLDHDRLRVHGDIEKRVQGPEHDEGTATSHALGATMGSGRATQRPTAAMRVMHRLPHRDEAGGQRQADDGAGGHGEQHEPEAIVPQPVLGLDGGDVRDPARQTPPR